jgi:multidrug efflux pump subunit AcrB
MWIVSLALRRPYTFVVVALLILIIGAYSILRMPKDIFPFINIPVVSVIWNFAGMPSEEFAQRITTYSEYSLSNNVNDIERIESQSLDGIGLIRLFFHPGADVSGAVAQATAGSQSILRRMPPGMQPPVVLRYNANTVPLIQMVLSSQTLTEQQLYDYGIFRIRQFISTIQGTTLPTPYGGKVRQVMVDLDPVAMQAKGVSARDVNDAVNKQMITTPTGDARIGNLDYRVNVNNTPALIESMNSFPIKVVNDTVVFLRDVGHAHDGYIPQNNIVRDQGLRAVLLTILKNGSTSTLEIINSVKELLKTIRAAAPEGMQIELLFDQSIFVKAAIQGVVLEGIIAAMLTGVMILVFLGSWRSTLIVLVSIPLSILSSIILLSFIGETLNLMTLGGLALAIGILVDDATVTIENIHRNIGLGKPLTQAILDGSQEVAIPAFVSTLSICIVFLPVILLVGPSKFLFVPFAMAVVFAVSASYILSRTLVPVMIAFLVPGEMHLYSSDKTHDEASKNWLDRYHERFDKGFNRFRERYEKVLGWALSNRGIVFILFGMVFVSALLLIPFIGEDFFPTVDAGQFRLHVKAPTGTRIEVTEEIFGSVEQEIKKVIPESEIQQMIDNIGLPAEPYNLAFGDMATLGGFDGEILVSLAPERTKTTPQYMELVRDHLNKTFPHITFYYQPADMVNQILNFGLPAPIDIRVIGYNTKENLKIADELVERVSHIPGAVDVHMQQAIDGPELFLDVDRTRLAEIGLTQRDISNDILVSFSTSATVTPNFWLDRQMGIPYLIATQTPKYRVNSVEELLRTPISSSLTKQSQLLSDLVKVERRTSPSVVTHFNIQPVYDVFANVQGRDLGGVSREIQSIVDELNPKMSPGNKIIVAGLVDNMNTAFSRLGLGFIFAIILVYFIMVINFQSWLDPFIIIMALPGAIAGIIWMLFLSQTTFSVPSLMGTIMSIGVATANSILLVSFANMQLHEGKDSISAMLDAGGHRLRPVLMTALAMIVGMLPMALGLGEGGEQNAPLGRAVIGGLTLATLRTLFFVPVVFSLLRKKANPYLFSKNEQVTPPHTGGN